ncbi:MAG: hypothetical protein EBU88_19770 [Acidobacteria bacterium]|nr:hypothetical protein [Acidobacteriota bacterium]
MSLILLWFVCAAIAHGESFEIRSAAPMVGRNLTVYPPDGSVSTVGTFALFQAGSWSGGAPGAGTWNGASYSVIYSASFNADSAYAGYN